MDAKAVAFDTKPSNEANPSDYNGIAAALGGGGDDDKVSNFKAANDNGTTAGGGGGGGGGDGDGGFLSGEKEFDKASEKPEKGSFLTPMAGSVTETSSEKLEKGSFLTPMAESVREDVGGESGLVGDEKVRVLEGEESVGEGVEEIGDEGFVDKVENGEKDVDKFVNGKKDVPVEMKSNSGEIELEKVDEEKVNGRKGVEGVEGVNSEIDNGGEKSGSVVESEEKSEVVEGKPEERVINGQADDNGDDKLIESEGVKLTSEGDSIVDSSIVDAVNVEVAKPGVVIIGDVKESEEVPSDETSVSLDKEVDQTSRDAVGGTQQGDDDDDDKSVKEAGVKLTSEGDPFMDSTVVDTIHVDVPNPGVAAVGNVDEDEKTENKEKEMAADEVIQTSRVVEVPDDLTAAYDGNAELVAENIVATKEVEPDGQKESTVLKDNDVEETEAGVDDSSNVGLASEEKQSVATAELERKAETNSDVNEVVSGEKIGDSGDEIPAIEPGKVELSMVSEREFSVEAEGADEQHPGGGDMEDSGTDEETEEMIFGSSEAAKKFLEELEKESGVESHTVGDNLNDRVDGQIVTDSDEEADSDEEGEGKELFDSATLAALLKAATGSSSDGGNITITSQDGSRLFSLERPAGLGSSLLSVKPAGPRPNRSNIFSSLSSTSGEGDSENNLSEEERKKLEKLQNLRVKYLRLVHKLGHSVEDSIAAQVLYRLALLAGRQTGQLFSLDSAKRTAMELEAEGKDDLDFSLNILVLGKAGVGKSATVNSLFGDQKAVIDAFEPATTSVREIKGTVDGVRITVIDTPGLKSSAMQQNANRKLLSSVKKVTKKCPPDIVLYVDRLDAQTRDLNDLPLLRTITSTLGSSIWKNAIVTLTHAASAPPDGPSGSPLSYEVFVAQRSHIVQQSIGQAVGDLRLMNPSLMNPVSLVENHPSCRKNRDGQKVLPNGQTWRPQLLLLCYSLKVISEAASLSKPQDPFDHRRLFGLRVRSPPLPYLLSWLLQSRAHPKLSPDQGGDNGDSDIDLDDVSDSDEEDVEDEYDSLPPFKPLRKAQLAKLTKEQRKAYFEEYDYRVKLLQKKQWREELKRMRDTKKKGKLPTENEYGGFPGEEDDPEYGAPAAVPVPLPDMVLPPSFDSDNPAYRYRFLEPNSQLLTRPVLDTHGWDHDCGYDGVNVEQSLALASRFPAAVSVQVTKDKKEFNIHLDSSIAAKHGENGSTMAGFDIQNVGKQLAYVVRGETKFKNLKKNKMALGGSVTFLGENVATGVKIEDQITLGKRLVLVGSTGTVRSQGDSAYGANLEIRLREADFPIGQEQSSLGLSLVKWRGDLALGANLQSQFSVGRNSKIAVRAGLNNKMSGQITVRTSSSDQLQIALAGILPIAMAIYKSIRPGTSEKYSMY